MRNGWRRRSRATALLLSVMMAAAPIADTLPAYAAEDASGVYEEGVSGGAMFVNGGLSGSTADGVDDALGRPVNTVPDAVTAVSAFSTVGGWNESIYAEIAGVSDADVTAVSYTGPVSGSLEGNDLAYLVRDNGNGGVRIDIPGLKAGTYTLTVVAAGSTVSKEGIEVSAYDRSGFAHFQYTDGVGAYKDDGTLKENAIVLYVTDENKNTVTLSYGGKTVTGIGNILNSVGQESSGGLAGNGGTANTNQGIIKDLAKANIPLVVRFVGTVSDSGLYKRGTFDAKSASRIVGLTAYASLNQGGSTDDNGHMARMQSGKDVTLEGIGSDAVIDGWGFHFICQSSDPTLGESFEVRNLTFINTPEDAVGMEGQQASKNASSQITAGVERCWIHHNSFYCPQITNPAESDKSEGDGSVDFKRGQYFTCSYNYFEGCHKTNLVGSADYSLQFNLTYHHNLWFMCKARGPLARRANIHMYNNIWEMQTDYAENTRADAYIFSEYNLFYACKSPQAVEAGAIKSYHDSVSSVLWQKGSQGTVVTDRSEIVPNNCQYAYAGIDYSQFDTTASQSYIPGGDYELQEDFTQLRKVIASQTGAMAQSPKKASEVKTTDYSIIQKSGATVHEIAALPMSTAPGKLTKATYAFSVNAPFDIEVAYGSAAGVLVNEAGENLLEGDGGRVNLPAGTYMFQPIAFQPGTYVDSSSFVIWKEFTISSLNITAHDPNAHYHTWDAGKVTTKPSCTEAGIMTYTCTAEGCTTPAATKTADIPALGHDWGEWEIVTPATETEAGEKKRACSRCEAVDTEVIPVGGTGSEAAGDYVLTFTGSKENDEADFFTVSGNFSNNKGSATVNGTTYEECLKMESKTSVSFTCNAGSTLFMAFASTETGKGVKVDGEVYTTDDKATVTVTDLTAGTHTVTKGDSMNLFYMSVKNGAAPVVNYQLTVDYNYDDAPDAKEIEVVAGKTYASAEELLPADFARNGYVLKGLYTDADCQNAVVFPYVVSGNATLYADWTYIGTGEEKIYGLHVELAEPDAEYVYTGKALQPEIIVTNNGETLAEGVDYTVKYSNNIKAAAKDVAKAPAITVTGKGRFTGKVTATFTIAPKSLLDEDVQAQPVVTSNAAKAVPVIVYNGMTLKKNKDFTFQYNAETKEFAVNGAGNYVTEKDAPLMISVVEKAASDLKKFAVTVGKEKLYYNGAEQTPVVTVTDAKDKTKVLTEGTDYVIAWPLDTTNAGTVKFNVIGLGDYAGSVAKSYKINSLAATAEVKTDAVAKDGYTFDAKGVTIGQDLALTVQTTVDGQKTTLELVEGKDYTVSYSANKKVGTNTAKYTFKFLGNFKGTKAAAGTFSIVPASLADLHEDGLVQVAAVGKTVKKAGVYKTVPYVSVNGTALKKSDMILTYYIDEEMTKEMTKATPVEVGGTVYVKIVGKGNYAAKDAGDFISTVYKVVNVDKTKDLSKAKIVDAKTGKALGKQEYTGEEIKPVIKVMIGAADVPADAYDVTYVNNVNKGKATIVITAKEGNAAGYAGSKAQNFTISAGDLRQSAELLEDMKNLLKQLL